MDLHYGSKNKNIPGLLGLVCLFLFLFTGCEVPAVSPPGEQVQVNGDNGETGGEPGEEALEEGEGDKSREEELREEKLREEQLRLEQEREEEARRLQEAQEAAQEAWRLKEEALREELGKFFVPLPPLEPRDNPPVKAKALYLTGHSVGHQQRFKGLLEMVESTELNSMVIDVKDDHGLMSYPSEIEIVQEVKAARVVPVRDMAGVIALLEEKNIYPIARVVVFKDPHLPEYRPEWAIQRNAGGVWRDNKGVAWVNPYEKQVWDYNIAIAKEAALLGFREIQFDYVRFPENARQVDREAFYPGEEGLPKDEAIMRFLTYAREQLEDYNVYLGADVFGVISTSWGDSDMIGQTWELISPVVDYICPMVYPSHYGPGYFGFPVPDARPGETVYRALEDAVLRNAPLEGPAIIRPWLQSFTASWVRGHIPYREKEVRAQIDAALELGIDEYMIWNAGNRYMAGSFLREEEARAREERLQQEREEKGLDALGRTSRDALEIYLEAIRKRDWRDAYALQGTDFTLGHQAYREWVDSWTGRLFSYGITSEIVERDRVTYRLDIVIIARGEEYLLPGQFFQVYQENQVWKIRPTLNFMEGLVRELGE